MHRSQSRSKHRALSRVLTVCVCLLSTATCADGGSLSKTDGSWHPELLLPSLDGDRLALADLKGQVVLVNFWASWCVPCIEEMPGIRRLADRMRGKPFAVIGVNVAEGEMRVRTAARRLKLGFPVLLDRDSATFNRWGATVLPTAYILDGDGAVRYVGRGPLEWDGADVIDLLEGLMQPESGLSREAAAARSP